ncbi:MAG: hypothetical protein RI940_563 [Bacteroidota bacterium]|jgi:hypothetical protein
MEVHHPHTAHSSNHQKKLIKEYISEFLMLFLAVTLGFFAENKREHYVEREREHHYMQSFYEDLKRDTAELNSVRRTYTRQIKYLDTTVNILFAGKTDTQSIRKLYELNLGTLGSRGVRLIERTTAQLKNAGGLRLVENNKISDQIAVYWHWASFIQAYGESTEELKIRAREKSYLIFNSGYYQNQERGNVNSKVKAGAQLMTTDKNTIIEYANRLNHIKNAYKNVSIAMLDSTQKVATNIMDELKKEYHVN